MRGGAGEAQRNIGALGPIITRMANIKVTDFMARFRDKEIDVSKAGSETALAGVSVGEADYNGDGVVSGEIELRRLFAEVDHLDSDGNPHTMDSEKAQESLRCVGDRRRASDDPNRADAVSPGCGSG